MTALVRASATAVAALALATTLAALPAEAAAVPVTLVLSSTGGTVRSGDLVTMTVRSFRAGTAIPESGVSFVVQERLPGTSAWFSAGEGQTGTDGQRQLWEGPKQHTEFRVVGSDDGYHGAAVSNSVTYRVTARLVAEAIQGDEVSQGFDQIVAVMTGGELAGRKVTLWRRQGKAWKRVKAGVLTMRYGSARRDFPVSTQVTGKHRYRATIEATPSMGAATSRTIMFRVVA